MRPPIPLLAGDVRRSTYPSGGEANDNMHSYGEETLVRRPIPLLAGEEGRGGREATYPSVGGGGGVVVG